ncbi:capsular biosynthesis protein [Clostridiaceae bacterium DONG20-135]|uniref:Capsular biosynthesis protein n=1 Tax=Copranaerobaculum intestinale TaxID=2692629 RepID=A0A6N8U466_9FIRM|nr:Wzz/FepE/Etk N-terminal domain-containing protein [Copranaerobaculum intestinale]MXQ72760.1 capsular biosynthesis protein [Copranaerobaculum intestinale]
MEETNNEQIEINLIDVYKALKKNWKFIAIMIVLFAVVFFLISNFFLAKKYASESTLLLTPKVTEGSADYSSVTVNNSLADNYVILLKGSNVRNRVVDRLKGTNHEVTAAELSKGLSAVREGTSMIIKVSATADSAEKAKAIVQTTVNVFTSDLKDILNLDNVIVSDEANLNKSPVSPNVKTNSLIGAFLGGVLSCGFIAIKSMLDKRLKNKQDAESYLGIPVLVEIPYFESN